jgi:hypothetical protein
VLLTVGARERARARVTAYANTVVAVVVGWCAVRARERARARVTAYAHTVVVVVLVWFVCVCGGGGGGGGSFKWVILDPRCIKNFI